MGGWSKMVDVDRTAKFSGHGHVYIRLVSFKSSFAMSREKIPIPEFHLFSLNG